MDIFSKLGSQTPYEKKALSSGGFPGSKLWSDGDLGEFLEKPGTVKDIGVLPDKAQAVRMWGAPG